VHAMLFKKQEAPTTSGHRSREGHTVMPYLTLKDAKKAPPPWPMGQPVAIANPDAPRKLWHADVACPGRRPHKVSDLERAIAGKIVFLGPYESVVGFRVGD
jgi:hypothetical protein